MLSFLCSCSDKGIEKSLAIWSIWKPFKRILETISPISSLWTQSEFYMQRKLYPGGNCSLPPPATSPPATSQMSCMLSFWCYDKGIEKSLIIWSSKIPSRGCWKQFLLSHPYEHRIYMQQKGHSTPGQIVPPLHPSCMLSFLCSCSDKGIEKSLAIWSIWKPFKRILETISPISSLWTQSEFTCSGNSTPG